MGMLKILTSLLIAIVIFESAAQAIRCYTCTNVDSNSKCRLRRCRRSSDGCENVVRVENGLILISKGCQQTTACRANSRQNRRQCTPLVQTFLRKSSVRRVSRNLPPSVCRSCCTKDRCNAPLYLQEATLRPSRRGSSSWRSLRPVIRNVRITVLNSDSALITFIDRKNHTSKFFSFRTYPYSSKIKISSVFYSQDAIPGVNHRVPRGALTYLATGLNAGRSYRLTIISRQRNYFYQHRIYEPFITRPRPPARITVDDVDVNSITVHVPYPQLRRGDRLSTFSISYRKVSDPPSATRRLSNYRRPQLKTIENLEPSTEYIIHAWTNVVDSRGRLIARSEKINTTMFTDVPGIMSVEVEEVHATSMTWNIRVPEYATRRNQRQFIIRVHDDTNQIRLVETVIPSSRRSYTATGLTPQTAYGISVTARTNNRESNTRTSDSTFTLIRCYSCVDARSRAECDQYIECPANSGGCLNEVRRRSFSNGAAGWYRATLRCKQVVACNNSELQDRTMQCNPDRDRNIDPPDVCRCCCEGDMCNGPAGNCGHILGWLDPFRSPPASPTLEPPFCPDPRIAFGEVTCTNDRELGSVCTYECVGDTYLSGASSITCFSSGRWSAELPACMPSNTCPDIPESEGTTYNCTRGFKSGSRCTVECMEGFLIAGDAQIRCLSTGSWNQQFIPTCLSENNCQPDPCYNGATCSDGVNDFECDCVPGWTGKVCDEEVRCERLVRPENGQLQCTEGNHYLSRCRYSCDYGYEQHGSTYTRCLADGYWSAFEPTVCVVKTCPVPPLRLVNNGRTECSGFGLGDVCQFSCPPGLKVAGGPENITCRPDETWSGNVPCCDLPCPPHAKVDLYFLLDSSSSVGSENWGLLVNFTISLLNEFVVGPNDMVVGVGRYNRRFDQSSEIPFGDYKNYEDLKERIRAIPYDGSGTRTGRALRHVYDVSLRAPGNRADVPDILVVITDGRSQDRPAVFAEFIRRNRKATIYAVGVRNQFNRLNINELLAIASGPSNMHIMDDGYEQLVREFKDTLAREVCWIPCQYQYEQREVVLRQRQLAAMTGDELDAQFWSQFDANNGTTTTTSISTTTPTPAGPDVRNTRPTIPIEPEVEVVRPIIEEEIN